MGKTDLYPKVGSMINKRYKVTDIIGTGGTAIVLHCRDCRTSREIALKRYLPDKLTKNLQKKVFAETKLLINSDYLVIAEGCFQENGYLHSIMPFVEGDNLCDILDSRERIDVVPAIYTALCLTKAASDLHTACVISTDIKLDNTIITPEGIAKLIDLTCFEKIGYRAKVSLGTIPYAAPELVNHDYLYESTDLYSIGVVLCAMLIGSDEFSKLSSSWELNIKRGIKLDIAILERNYPEPASIINRTIAPKMYMRYKCAKELFNDLLKYYNSITGLPAKKSKLKLLCKNGKELCVQEGRIVIGRNAIDVRNFIISEKHFEIKFDGETDIKVRDVGSTNGTYIMRGKKLGNRWVKLKDTDVIQIGNVQLMVKVS